MSEHTTPLQQWANALSGAIGAPTQEQQEARWAQERADRNRGVLAALDTFVAALEEARDEYQTAVHAQPFDSAGDAAEPRYGPTVARVLDGGRDALADLLDAARTRRVWVAACAVTADMDVAGSEAIEGETP